MAVLVAEHVRDGYKKEKIPHWKYNSLDMFKGRIDRLLGPLHERNGREALFALARARAGPLSEAACTLLFRPTRAAGGKGAPPSLLDKYMHESMYVARHALSAKPLSKFSNRSTIVSIYAPWNARWDAATNKFVCVPLGRHRQHYYSTFLSANTICKCHSVPCRLLHGFVPSCAMDSPDYETTDMLVIIRSLLPADSWWMKRIYSCIRELDGTRHFATQRCARDGPEYANTYVGSRWATFRADGRTAMVFSGAAERMFAAMKKEQRAYRAARRAQERPQPVRKRARRE